MKLIILIVLSLIFKTLAYQPPGDFCLTVDKHCLEEHAYCNTSRYIPGYEPIRLNPIMKKYILKLFNDKRDDAACGRLVNFDNQYLPKAAKMPALIWDDELEWIATHISRGCTLARNVACQSTPNYRVLGGVIASEIRTEEKTAFQKLEPMVESLAMQHYNTPVSSIYYYPGPFLRNKSQSYMIKGMFRFKIQKFMPVRKYNFNRNLDFAEIVKDSNTKIGCAMNFCGESGVIRNRDFKVHCVFDGLVFDKLYRTSDVVGSECGNMSKKYSCLCWNHDFKEPGAYYPKVIRLKVKINGVAGSFVCRFAMILGLFLAV